MVGFGVEDEGPEGVFLFFLVSAGSKGVYEASQGAGEAMADVVEGDGSF